MKAESNVMPNVYDYNIRGDIAVITLYDNLEETTDEEGEKKYTFETYELLLQHREGLTEDIENDYNKYLELAKKKEYDTLAKEVRAKRDKLLNETDKYMIADFPVEDDEREQYKTYRQALRDITEQENFPYSVEFPEKP